MCYFTNVLSVVTFLTLTRQVSIPEIKTSPLLVLNNIHRRFERGRFQDLNRSLFLFCTAYNTFFRWQSKVRFQCIHDVNNSTTNKEFRSVWFIRTGYGRLFLYTSPTCRFHGAFDSVSRDTLLFFSRRKSQRTIFSRYFPIVTTSAIPVGRYDWCLFAFSQKGDARRRWSYPRFIVLIVYAAPVVPIAWPLNSFRATHPKIYGTF